jgi:hypothetical protein
MKYRWPILVLCVLCSLSACSFWEAGSSGSGISWYPPDAFQESDLFGTWQNWRIGYGNETLTLDPDHSFLQIYDTSLVSGEYHYEGQGDWWLEYRPSGCVYVHLEGMRYYHYHISVAENGNRYGGDGILKDEPMLFWEPCEDKRIEMPDKVILSVGGNPDFPGGLKLSHVAPSREWANELLERVSTPVPVPDS